MNADVLKKKVINDFNKFLCEVRKGYKPDYELILEEISFVDILLNNELDAKLSLIALLYYLNNIWQKQS